ncbi:MAG: hypothetical protein ACOZBL_04135 [Patescibacteria group bacterium]
MPTGEVFAKRNMKDKDKTQIMPVKTQLRLTHNIYTPDNCKKHLTHCINKYYF